MTFDEGARDVRTLTSGRLVMRNTIWNLVGRCLPAAAAIATIPPLLRALGPDRFGLLTLALTFIGYFGLLDFGLGRAITQGISERIGKGRESETPAVVWTALRMLLALSLIGMVLSAGLTPLVIRDVLHVPHHLEGEAIGAFYVLSLSIPFVIGNAALWGVLAAYQRFDLGNKVSVPLGIVTYVGPLLILQWSDTLVAAMTVLLILRVSACVGLAVMCMRVVPELKHRAPFEKEAARHLVAFGGWLTLSSMLAPLMASADRFIIGGAISIGAVAYYTTAYEVISKLWILPVAILTVLAPAMAASISGGTKSAGVLFERALFAIFVLLLSASLMIALFAREGMTLWLGPDFAEHSTRISQLLALGMFLSFLAQTPVVAMSSRGRPDIAAKLQIVEFPIFFPIMYGAVITYGIDGAAAVWTVRALVEAVVVFMLAARVVPETRRAIQRVLGAIPLVLVAFALSAVTTGLAWKLAVAGAFQLILAIVGWQFVLTRSARQLLLGYLRNLQSLFRA